MKARKDQKIEQIIQGEIGVDYAEFKRLGKDMPDADWRDIWLQIRLAKMDACFILAGFQYGQLPLLAATTAKYKAALKEDFAAVGSGDLVARAALLYRAQSDVSPLPLTIYNVFEAKKYAERIPTVGTTTTLQILRRGGSIETLTDEGKEYLLRIHGLFGPKQIDQEIDVQEAFFTRAQHPETDASPATAS